jgi:hypothetical protein
MARLTSHNITETLSQVTSLRMDAVSFRIVMTSHHDDDNPSCLEWSQIDDALAQPTFSKLRLVEITIIWYYHTRQWVADRFPELCASIAKRLPSCNARGILRIRGVQERIS